MPANLKVIVMQFRISKTNNGNSTQWAIIPTSGKFEDKVVAVADAVNMSNAHFVAKTCIGTIKSVWGLEIQDPEIYHDRETLRGLSLGKAIYAFPTEVLTLDYDGYWDVAKRKCSRARRLLCFCDAIYAKGAE